MVHLSVFSNHVTYAFQSESTLYSCLNVKEFLAQSRRETAQMIELCSGYLSECGFTLKRVRHMTRTYSQMHCTNKCSEHSSVIWPVRPNGLVFLYELSGSGFEFICRISKDSLLLHLLSCKSLIFVKENPDRKKNKLCFRTCKNRLSVCDG